MQTTTLISEDYSHPLYRVADPGLMISESVSPVTLLISTFPKDNLPELDVTVDQEPQLAEDAGKVSLEESGDEAGHHMTLDTLVVVENPLYQREMTNMVQGSLWV